MLGAAGAGGRALAQASREFDAFVSYDSVDRRAARRIQRFLESYRPPGAEGPLRVFLDRTDLRGGPLEADIEAALRGSRTLVLCWSPDAADSAWVDKEIGLFSSFPQGERVAVAHVDGRGPPHGPASLAALDPLQHDLRSGWWLGVARPRARLELIRLLAFLTDVPLRSLRNWALRRALRNLAIGVVAALAPVALVLSIPLPHWQALELEGERGPLYAVAAEVVDGGLWTAERLRGPGPQGFRDYLFARRDSLAGRQEGDGRADHFALRKRLLPAVLLPYELARELPAGLRRPEGVEREPVGPPWAGQLAGGARVVVQPLGLTQEEEEHYYDQAADLGTPIPQSMGSLVAVHDGTRPRVAHVPDLSLNRWREKNALGDQTSPFAGIAVAMQQDGQMWLGVRATREQQGGLWHSPKRGASWVRQDGFRSVASIEVLRDASGGESVVVAERHADLWSGGLLVPYPTRVVRREGEAWVPAEAPPYGTRSEVELCGSLPDGTRLVRVDERVHRLDSRTLFTLLLALLSG